MYKHTQSMAQTILVIDDERAIRKTLAEILTFEGYVIDEAADGAGHEEGSLHCGGG